MLKCVFPGFVSRLLAGWKAGDRIVQKSAENTTDKSLSKSAKTKAAARRRIRRILVKTVE
jgi:hypothetical protein